jgi:thymidine kinase
MTNKKPGRFTLICGPMFAGKTELLIAKAKDAKKNNLKIMIFKPQKDNRYSETEICSHNGITLEAHIIKKDNEILEKSNKNLDIIFIDEIQFLTDNIVSIIKLLQEEGVNIVASGFELDFRGKPFGKMPLLLCLADNVIKLSATCSVCGGTATRSTLLSKSVSAETTGNPVIIGGSDKYAPRCIHHFRQELH